MSASYAVVWRAGDGPSYVGKVDVRPNLVHLDGATSDGRVAVEDIFFEDIAGVRIAREGAQQIQGRPTLVIERRLASDLRVTSADRPGALHELIDRVATLTTSRTATQTRMVASMSLKEGARGLARAMLEQGPPFDPEASSLERHFVYLTDTEVIFIFEGKRVEEFVGELLGDASVWKTAASWEDLAVGPLHVAEVVYAWERR